MSNKRSQNKKAYQKKRSVSKCIRRNKSKEFDIKLRDLRQREYLEKQIKAAKARAAANEAAETKKTTDGSDLSNRWHVIDKDTNQVLSTAKSRSKAREINAQMKEIGYNSMVVDSHKE